MRVRNVFGIVIRNYGLYFKTLLYKFVVFAVFAVTTILVLQVRMRDLYDALYPVIQDVFATVKSLFSSVGSQATDTTSQLSAHWNEFLAFLSKNYGSLAITAVLLFLIVFLYRFFCEIADCVSMITFDEHMSSLRKTPYVSTLFANLRAILKFVAVEVIFACAYALIVGAATYGLILLLYRNLPILLPFFILLFIFACQGLYNTFTSQFMAKAIIEKKSLKLSVKEGLRPEKKYFWKMYASYTLINVVVYYLFSSSLIFTFGVGTVFLIPLASIFVCGMKTMDYYVINTRKYFIDYDNIVVPKELRENDEQLLKDVEI